MRRLATVAGAVVVVGYAILVASVRSFTWPAFVLTALPGLAIVALAARRAAGRPRPGPGRGGLGPWAALAAAVLVWELIAFVQSPRDDHPTISSILDVADAHRPLRAALFVGWIALGRELVRR